MLMISRFRQFLRKTVYSLPDDIERPYHKVVNLALKTIGLTFMAAGAWFCYFSLSNYFVEFRPYCSNEISATQQFSELARTHQKADTTAFQNCSAFLLDIIFLFLAGIACLLITMAVGPILLLRYIAFTLPDRIYMRNYAKMEEKEEKKKGARLRQLLLKDVFHWKK